MNRMALWVMVAGLAAPLAADVRINPGSAGEVTLDWQKFNDLWTKMQSMEKQIETLEHPENLPPVPFTITRAAYKGDVRKKKVDVAGVFEIDIFEKKNWVKIPFLPSSVALREARLDGNAVGVTEESGFHQLVLRNPGRHVLTVSFTLTAPDPEQAPQLFMPVPQTPMTILSMSFPQKGLDVTVEPSQGTDSQTIEGGKTLVTASIPPTSQITLHWQKAAAEEAAGPAKLYVDTESLMTLSEGSAKTHVLLNYNILHHSIRELRVQVPESWNVLSVNAEGLQEWKRIETPQGPAIAIQLAFAKKGLLGVSVDLEKGIGEKEDVMELPRLKPVDVEREQGTIGVEARGSVELQIQESNGLNAVDPQELPSTLWQGATQPILFAFRYTKPHTLTVAVKRHPEVAVLTTTVDDANAVTLMTERGQMITRIRYQVRNHLKQFLAIRLPEGAELWSAFVDNAPVKPTRIDNGSYRIPLAKSQIEGQGQQGFPVEIVYFMPVPKFMPAGYKATQFPIPDAPVSRLFWSLYLPEHYRFLRFGGDLEKGMSASPFNAILGNAFVAQDEMKREGSMDAYQEKLKKDFSTISRIRMAAKSSPAAAPAEMAIAGNMAVSRQAEMEAGLFDRKAQQFATGVFPVAFDVPASGQLFRFGQVMVIGESPRLSMVYVHAAFVRVFSMLCLSLLGFGLWKIRGLWMPYVTQLPARFRALSSHRTAAV